MYQIVTARNDYQMEFECKNKSQVVKVIDFLGSEFEKNKE